MKKLNDKWSKYFDESIRDYARAETDGDLDSEEMLYHIASLKQSLEMALATIIGFHESDTGQHKWAQEEAKQFKLKP